MLHVGISWNATGYETAVADGSLRPARPGRRFRGGAVDELMAHLSGLGEPLVAVIDSTNGTLDGPLLAAGFPVARLDPGALPARPLLGSVDAGELAEAAVRTPGAATPLDPGKGTMTGREAEALALIPANSEALSEAVAAGRCLLHGARDSAVVALTFDDGPFRPYTGQILDVLDRHEVRATFFCIGLGAATHAADVARIHERGHTLGNHTWSHPYLPDLSREEFTAQLSRTQLALAEASGGAPPALFRPPYGSLTPEIMRWLAELDLTTALWDVGSRDWARPEPAVLTRTVLDQVQPGSIVTLHDGGGDRSRTVAALPAVITGLRDRGFRFVTVDELAPVRR
ncbi:polysaccharide deacetylase family protein [Amycolatopsis sp. H6(2020)]|nr:polysaccharide deacetylase family protein [Amycolatopsis sp. H6(2020)]